MWECFWCSLGTLWAVDLALRKLACFARRVDSEWRELVPGVSKPYHLQFVVETLPKHTEDHKARISIVFCCMHPGLANAENSKLHQSCCKVWILHGHDKAIMDITVWASKHQNLTILNYVFQLGVVLHTCSPSILKAEVEGSLTSSRQTWAT